MSSSSSTASSPTKSDNSSTGQSAAESTPSRYDQVKNTPMSPPSPSTPESRNEHAPPVYTRRLIRRILIPGDEIDENFDEKEWFKKVYGPDIVIVQTDEDVPDGWILVDGTLLASLAYLITRSQ